MLGFVDDFLLRVYGLLRAVWVVVGVVGVVGRVRGASVALKHELKSPTKAEDYNLLYGYIYLEMKQANISVTYII